MFLQIAWHFLKMNVKFYLHENLTAAENFYNNILVDIQILITAFIYTFLKSLPEACKNLHAHF